MAEDKALAVLKELGMTDEEAAEFVEGVKRGLKARREGKVVHWSELVKELNLHGDFGRFLLRGFPHIGPTLANSIVERFGRVPLSWSCTLDELKSVPGMGEHRAEALWKLLR